MNNFENKLLVISTSPSDYGMLETLSKEVSNTNNVELLCLFEPYVKNTLNSDNLNINIQNLNLTHKPSNDKVLFRDLKKINQFFKKFLLKTKHDLVLILGDRYELLTIAQLLYLNKKIIIHLHGGEITEGSWDDSIRHSISKLSHIHFVASNDAVKRLTSMGEQPKNIFNEGSLGAYNVKNLELIDKEELFKNLDLNINKKVCFLVMQPMTNENFDMTKNLDVIVKFLIMNKFDEVVISDINSDPGSIDIIKFFENRKYKEILFKKLGNLGLKKFISLCKHSDLVIGNSSSFIYELPMKNIKSILVTDRQKGRLLSEHIFPASIDINSLNEQLLKLNNTNTNASSVYYNEDTPRNMAEKIDFFIHNLPEFKKVFGNEK